MYCIRDWVAFRMDAVHSVLNCIFGRKLKLPKEKEKNWNQIETNLIDWNWVCLFFSLSFDFFYLLLCSIAFFYPFVFSLSIEAIVRNTTPEKKLDDIQMPSMKNMDYNIFGQHKCSKKYATHCKVSLVEKEQNLTFKELAQYIFRAPWNSAFVQSKRFVFVRLFYRLLSGSYSNSCWISHSRAYLFLSIYYDTVVEGSLGIMDSFFGHILGLEGRETHKKSFGCIM